MRRPLLNFIRKIIQKITRSNKTIEVLYKELSWIKTQRNKNLDDCTFYKNRFKEYMGKDLDLESPKTFNEKLIWLQMYDRKPIYTMLADKFLVKKFVAETIGERYVVPLLGVWDSAEDIPFATLPEECVLKCNHDCGSIYVKNFGQPFDVVQIKREFSKALSRNYYNVGRVWCYKDIQPKVFCEELIETEDGKFPLDYKIFCFDGEPKFSFVASDRGKRTKFDFFDLDWKRIPVRQHYPNSEYNLPMPICWTEMLDCARKLSKGIPHVRVDFYVDKNQKLLFGEMTTCHFSATEPFDPPEYDILFGSYLVLPPELQVNDVR